MSRSEPTRDLGYVRCPRLAVPPRKHQEIPHAPEEDREPECQRPPAGERQWKRCGSWPLTRATSPVTISRTRRVVKSRRTFPCYRMSGRLSMSDPIGVPSRAPHARIERAIASSRRLTCTLAVALAACGDGNIGGGSGSPTGPPAHPNAVSVGNNFFSPTSRTVAVGTTVTWTGWPGPQRTTSPSLTAPRHRTSLRHLSTAVPVHRNIHVPLQHPRCLDVRHGGRGVRPRSVRRRVAR